MQRADMLKVETFDYGVVSIVDVLLVGTEWV